MSQLDKDINREVVRFLCPLALMGAALLVMVTATLALVSIAASRP